MNISFRKATEADLDAVFRVFVDAIANMDRDNIPQWDEVYPDRGILSEDIAKNQLNVGIIDDEIICAYVINTEYDEEYSNGAWQYPNS